MKLNEWTKGKGIVMMDRLFKVLSKKTGETYKICQIPEIYQNRYGKFVGYFVVGSSGTVYRANFVVNASTEEVVSIDRFDKNDDKLITPKDTLSFEGFNIVQIYNCVLANAVILVTHVSSDSESGRYGDSQKIHLGNIGTFTAKQITHAGVTFGTAVAKQINSFIFHITLNIT